MQDVGNKGQVKEKGSTGEEAYDRQLGGLTETLPLKTNMKNVPTKGVICLSRRNDVSYTLLTVLLSVVSAAVVKKGGPLNQLRVYACAVQPAYPMSVMYCSVCSVHSLNTHKQPSEARALNSNVHQHAMETQLLYCTVGIGRA